MTGDTEQKAPAPFKQVSATVFQSVNGMVSVPYSMHYGFAVRIPFEQAKSGHNGEWEVLPPELNGELPAVIDGRLLDWSGAEFVDVLDIVTGEMIRTFRFAYRPPGAKTFRPTPDMPSCADPRKDAIREAFADYSVVAPEMRQQYVDGFLARVHQQEPLTPQERDEVDLAAATGCIPFDRPEGQ
jgi:hypothetical protein